MKTSIDSSDLRVLETQKIVYSCKECGWSVSIPKLWGDLKPKRCGGKKCKVSFLKTPEQLNIIK